ncbi:MAG: hypothetical protein WBD40_20365 [Tepidisphaeraceae bacterium]
MHQQLADWESNLLVPAPQEQVLPGVPWGRHDTLFTPAYWKSQCWLHRFGMRGRSHRIGTTLAEETAACLLGGHGMPSEVGLAAFQHLRKRDLLIPDQGTSASELAQALSEPLRLGTRVVRYRFPRARAAYVAAALHHIRWTHPADDSDTGFRAWLLKIKGVGLKTASWITRNWLGSSSVAILDIHVYRAGLIAGFFNRHQTVQSHYLILENAFLQFCGALGEDAAHLDAIIWRQMKECGELGRRALPDPLKPSPCSSRLRRAA